MIAVLVRSVRLARTSTLRITPEGKYFVVMAPKFDAEPDKAPAEQIHVTLNWFEELKQRVPVN
jgi:hypothetical protein